MPDVKAPKNPDGTSMPVYQKWWAGFYVTAREYRALKRNLTRDARSRKKTS